MWFCVSTLSLSEHPNGSEPSVEQVWEEHFFLIAANDTAEAKVKAERLAKSQQCTYEAANGSKVSWKFKFISKVFELDGEPADGTEVFSRFLKGSEVQSMQTSFS